MKNNVTVTVFDKEQYDGEWPPENAAECLAWFAEKIDGIPEEFRDTAKVEISSASGYEGSSYGHIEISYTRQETDEEEQKRETLLEHKAAAQQGRELAEFKKLQKKFGASA